MVRDFTGTLFLATLLSFTLVLNTTAQQKVILTPDHLFHLEELDIRSWSSPLAFSPDGQSFAYVLKRPLNTSSSFGLGYLEGFDRADIWLGSAAGGNPVRITDGITDHSGFWAPKWSPDGQWLAMLSTRGGNVKVWVWSKLSHDIKPLSDRGTDSFWVDDLQWLSSHELAFSVLPAGKTAERLTTSRELGETVAREWAKASAGVLTTASVLESGVNTSGEGRPQSELLLVDVGTMKERRISCGLSIANLRASPDGYTLAFLKQVGIWRPEPNETPIIHIQPQIYRIEVSEGHRAFQTRTLVGMREVFPGSVVWSPDGTELAAVGYSADSGAAQEQVFRCEIGEGACRPAAKRGLPIGSDINVIGRPPFLWYGRHDLIVFPHVSSSVSRSPKSTAWWTIDTDGEAHEYRSDPNGSPAYLFSEANESSLIGIVDGSIYRIGTDGRLEKNLTSHFGQRISSIEWPRFPTDRIGTSLIFSVHHAQESDLYHLELKSGRITAVNRPSLDAKLEAFDARTSTTLFSANNKTGTYLSSRKLGDDRFSTILETNTFLRKIYEGDLQRIEYRSLDGEELNGWIILPAGYQEGKRYPVITWVYPNQIYGSEAPLSEVRINEAHSLNLQLLAGHGYVVLLPSMPLQFNGGVDDRYLELSKGVLPAVDKLVELGIADPKRIGVMGHSYGGYATYGLITQTRRFRAAVALAGLSDLLAFYGNFEAKERYDLFVNEDPFNIWLAETSIGMASPPWKDLGAYLRNSPLNYVERVQTPLLIIQGDLDYIPVQQGEEFFSALYRQGKRAQFVRYWGEEHVIWSPANIRDMWARIFAWFDEFLCDRPNSQADMRLTGSPMCADVVSSQ